MKSRSALFILVLGLFFLACSNSKETGGTDGRSGTKKREEGEAHPPVRIVEKEEWEDRSSDPFKFQELGVKNELFWAVVRYSGGCEEHAFRLLAAPFKEKSDPPRRALFLEHDANGDACRSVILDTLRFHLGPLEKPSVLELEGAENSLRYGSD